MATKKPEQSSITLPPVEGASRLKTTILMVEDSFHDYEAVARSLRGHAARFDLRWCETADEAVDYLQQTGSYSSGYNAPRPQLILLDLYLPGCLSGLDFLEFVRSEMETELVPVIVFTTSDSPRDIERSYRAGANAYVQKPASPVVFEETIAAILTGPLLQHAR